MISILNYFLPANHTNPDHQSLVNWPEPGKKSPQQARPSTILPILFRGEMIALGLWALSTIIALLAKIERNTRR